jgi:glycosyltransferase involved in cell wall biosynthesis
MSQPVVSIVVPAMNAEATLAECLRAIRAQTLPAADRELIVVADTRSTDRTEAIARSDGATVVRHGGPNAGSARNRGVALATGRWIAFIDGDCIPVRGWLKALVGAAEAVGTAETSALGAAGQVIGYESNSPAARFVDLTGGLRADKHLSHGRYPWAPTANVLYRRAALLEVGGFDERFDSYEGCDLHTRLRRTVGGVFSYVPQAVTYHRHRSSWRAYWRQQVSYGRGFAQFFLCYDDELRWTARDEARAWLRIAGTGAQALTTRSGSTGLLKRGLFFKSLAQRRGFITTFWNRNEVRRWESDRRPGIEPAT